MIRKTKINDDFYVAESYYGCHTKIFVMDGDKDIILSDLKTFTGFSNEWVAKNGYVVNYSKGCMANQIPLCIEAVYDINNHRLLNITSFESKNLIENMFILQSYFRLPSVLQEINEVDLGLLKKSEKDSFNDYLTSGNKNISHEQVVQYILSCYPELSKYTNINNPLTVVEYRTIKDAIDADALAFFAMPQDLSFLEEDVLTRKKTK